MFKSRKLYLCLIVIFLAGCTNNIHIRGYAPYSNQINQIEVNKTTKKQVRNILSHPSLIDTSANAWIYYQKQQEQSGFSTTKTIKNQIYVIYFNKQNIVKAIRKSDALNLTSLKLNTNTTPNVQRNISILKRLFNTK